MNAAQLTVIQDEQSFERLLHLINNPPIQSRVLEFLPEWGEHILLKLNRGNRPVNAAKLKRYAADMLAGLWFLTGDTIKFSDKERLLDGQTRLGACVRSGKPFRTHVVFGIPDGAFDRLDRGKTRTAADVLAIAGYKNANALAMAIRWAWLIEENRTNDRTTIEPGTIRHLVSERYGDMEESIAVGSRLARTYGHPRGQMAALHYLFSRKTPVEANEFFESWIHGRSDRHHICASRLQQRLSTIRDAAHGRIHDRDRAMLVVIAWNAWRNRQRLRMSALESLPDEFPPID